MLILFVTVDIMTSVSSEKHMQDISLFSTSGKSFIVFSEILFFLLWLVATPFLLNISAVMTTVGIAAAG